MKYKQLGNSKLKVSEIALGSMTWGYQNSEAEAHEQLDYARAHGINFIDTAEVYTVPPQKETYTLTEQYIGHWLAQRGGREQLIIATKITGPGVSWVREGTGLTSDGIDAAIKGSLRRLKTDYIDLYQLHWPQRKTNYFGRRDFSTLFFCKDSSGGESHFLEILQTLKKHVDAGNIREVGLSNETPWGIMKYLQLHENDANLPRIQTVQNPYSLIQREFDSHTSEVCLRENVSLLAYSPSAGGILSGKYVDGTASADSRFNDWGGQRQPGLAMVARSDIIKQYVELAHRYQLDPVQMALAFVNNRLFVGSTIIGATTMAQLKTCVQSTNVQLCEALLNDIEQLHAKHPNPALF